MRALFLYRHEIVTQFLERFFCRISVFTVEITVEFAEIKKFFGRDVVFFANPEKHFSEARKLLRYINAYLTIWECVV